MKLGGMNKSTAATMKARIPDKLLQSVLLMASPIERGAVRPSPSLVFCCLILKIVLSHPYLKMLDLANLFVADIPMKKTFIEPEKKIPKKM